MADNSNIFELKIIITKGENNVSHVSTSFPEHAKVITIRNALHTLAAGLEGKMKEKAETIGFDDDDDLVTYLDNLIMNDLQ